MVVLRVLRGDALVKEALADALVKEVANPVTALTLPALATVIMLSMLSRNRIDFIIYYTYISVERI